MKWTVRLTGIYILSCAICVSELCRVTVRRIRSGKSVIITRATLAEASPLPSDFVIPSSPHPPPFATPFHSPPRLRQSTARIVSLHPLRCFASKPFPLPFPLPLSSPPHPPICPLSFPSHPCPEVGRASFGLERSFHRLLSLPLPGFVPRGMREREKINNAELIRQEAEKGIPPVLPRNTCPTLPNLPAFTRFRAKWNLLSSPPLLLDISRAALLSVPSVIRRDYWVSSYLYLGSRGTLSLLLRVILARWWWRGVSARVAFQEVVKDRIGNRRVRKFVAACFPGTVAPV